MDNDAQEPREFDILEMPSDGLAAYWLSVKKLMDARTDRDFLAVEIENTSEPFIRHLLETAFTEIDADTVARLARAKRSLLAGEYRRKIEMMRVALVSIAEAENPRRTLLRLGALAAPGPFNEKRTFEMAYALLSTITEPGADLATLLGVDHKQKDDRMVVKLLFYAIAARRSGKQALSEYLPHARSGYFVEGLSLCMDGFDARFLSAHLGQIRDAALASVRRKMAMSTELCLAIKAGFSYDDVFLVARAFLP